MNDRRPKMPPIGFAEVPDFHVSIVRREQPKLRGVSILVGGDPEKQGKVVAASADLRQRGIVEGMRLTEALARSPEAHWVRTELRLARELSGALRGAIREEVEAVEVDGLAGFYLRAPEETEEGPRARGAARRTASRSERDCPSSAWASRRCDSPRGLPPKMPESTERGSSRRPDFEAYLLGQPLERLPGVGPKTAARLAELGAVDVPGLRRIGTRATRCAAGEPWTIALATGVRRRPQAPSRAERHPDTLSRAETLTEATFDRPLLLGCLSRLATSLELALVREGLRGAPIGLEGHSRRHANPHSQ